MATFSVTIERTIVQSCTIELRASSEEAAQEKAEAAANKALVGEKQPYEFEWELESDNIEVTSVDEEG